MKIDFEKANRYNQKKENNLWSKSQIPWRQFAAGSSKFARATADFQEISGLNCDGMLGSKTLERLVNKEAAPVDDVDGFLIDGKTVPFSDSLVLLGVTLSSSLDGEVTFEHKQRKNPPDSIVIHESVTTSRATTIKVLDRKKYGVHFIVDGDGSISQHCDPVQDQPIHANQMNSNSIGIECVNPYYPSLMVHPWIVSEPAKWWTHVKKGAIPEYVLPTEKQIQSIRALVVFLSEEIPTIEIKFPTEKYGPRKTRVTDWKDKAKPEPGIVAHRDFAAHADGRGILERLFDLKD